MNRSFTRFIDSFYFLDYSSRLLLLGLMLGSLNFPGYYSFIAEVLSMISIMGISLVYSVLFVFCSVLNAIFWFMIYNRKLYYSGLTSLSFSVTFIEKVIISSLIGMMLLMGIRVLLSDCLVYSPLRICHWSLCSYFSGLFSYYSCLSHWSFTSYSLSYCRFSSLFSNSRCYSLLFPFYSYCLYCGFYSFSFSSLFSSLLRLPYDYSFM